MQYIISHMVLCEVLCKLTLELSCQLLVELKMIYYGVTALLGRLNDEESATTQNLMKNQVIF